MKTRAELADMYTEISIAESVEEEDPLWLEIRRLARINNLLLRQIEALWSEIDHIAGGAD